MSYWNTQAYRLFGPAYPADGAPITTQVVKSAFELEWSAQLPADQDYVLTGRSWSGNGPIAYTEVSTDGGRRWHRAIPRSIGVPAAWQLWKFPWRTPPPRVLRAPGTDPAVREPPPHLVHAADIVVAAGRPVMAAY